MRGVLLLALGNPYYGNYAVQLARSIKAVSPNIHISIAYSNGVLSHNKTLPFDAQIEVPKECYTTNGLPDYLKAKTYIYNLSPYDETIFLDADIIWLPEKPIEELFDECKGSKITISNKGREKLSEAKKGFIHWADPEHIREAYGNDGWLYNLASEFIYFERFDEVEELFDIAKEVYLRPGIEYKKFAFHLPDELAFEIAMIKTGLYPHKERFFPFYWEQYEKKGLKRYEMQKNYYGLSIGGNVLSDGEKKMYNELASIANAKFGISGCFPAKNKMSFLNERKSL